MRKIFQARRCPPRGEKRELVRKGGLEPPRLAAPDPKSGASANSATFARWLTRIVNATGIKNKLADELLAEKAHLGCKRFFNAVT